jgi:hypothetical protein
VLALFAPQAAGSRVARLEFNSADGGSIGVDLMGSVRLRLTVTRSGPGADNARVRAASTSTTPAHRA